MKKFKKSSIAIVLAIALVFGFTPLTPAQAATAPDLGVAATYSVYGDAGVTNDVGGVTNVWGNVGHNNNGATNLDDATQVDGVINAGAGVAGAASAAFDALAVWGGAVAKNLSTNPQTVTPGVYTVDATQTLTGDITLSGAGVYIFRSDSAYHVANSARVLLTNGATACNVFWRVPSTMTIGTNAQMVGTIIAGTEAITLNTGATLQGRALSLVAAVTLLSNQITEPTCASVGGGGSYVTPLFPLINVTKIPSPLALPSGPGSVTFNYKVTNVGVIPMKSIIVTDNKCSPTQFVSGDSNSDAKLDVGEEWIYRCTKIVSATETNIVTAQGSTDNALVRDTATATVVVGLPVIPPLIHLLKVPSTFLLPAGGGAVTYRYTVSNPGTEPLSNVFIVDNKCTGLPGRVVGHPGDLNKNNLLESNEIWSFTCQTNLTKTTTNIGTVEGSANGLTAVDYSSATVVVATPSLPKTGFPPKEEWYNIIFSSILKLIR